MVKNTYIAPATLTVRFGTVHMMAESLPIGTQKITSSEEILVKENNVSDVNVWDKEW